MHVEKERIELPPETDAVDELCKSSFGSLKSETRPSRARPSSETSLDVTYKGDVIARRDLIDSLDGQPGTACDELWRRRSGFPRTFRWGC